MRNFCLPLMAWSVALWALPAAAQSCMITAITATQQDCDGFTYDIVIDLTVEQPASDSFTLAGNGTIYGSWPYDSLPVTVGPFLGDDESTYSFVAWDKDAADCQAFVALPAANCGPICHFSDPALTFVTCISPSLAIVEFDIAHENMPGPAFNLFYENGSQVGSYLYSSLPITIPLFQVNGAAPIGLTICDQTNADCCATFSLDAIDCTPGNCELFSAIADPECTGANFLVHLDFGFDSPASDSFTVHGNGLDYGTFAYGDLPITLGPLNGNTGIEWEFVIADSGDPECQTTELLGEYHCPPPCDVLALLADALLCNGDEAYSLQVEVDIEGEGDHGFSILSPTYYYGSYAYDDLPVTLPAYEGSGEFYDQVTVCDNDEPGCCATASFEALLCAGCLIYNLEANPQPCNAENEIYVEINFDYNNVSPDGFEVTGNGNNYGTFLYEELPILIGPFPGDGSTYFEFVVTDVNDPFCFAAVEMGFVDCEDICELTDPVAEVLECTGNGTFAVVVDFEYQGVSGTGFDLWANGQFVGAFEYADLPLTILEFPANGLEPDTLTVCDNGDPDCCTSLVFEGPGCACEIVEAAYQVLECTSDSTFSVLLEIYAENSPNDFIDVYFDGVFLGFFSYATLPVLVPNVPEGDGEGVMTICINDLGTCCTELVIEQMLCDGPTCHLYDLLAEHGDCNSDSTYLLDIVFDHANLPSDSVAITANGVELGHYLVQPDFIRIEHFPVLENDTVELVVCAVGAPDCCDSYTFLAPDCSNFEQCLITNLVVDLGDCVTDTTYQLDLFFDYEFLPGDFVVITGNGEEVGTRLVNDGHIIFEAFPELPGGTTVELSVCALGNPECCATVVFEEPACISQTECHVWNLVAEAGECLTDSTFVLFYDFDVENLPGDQVVVYAGNQPIDTIFPTGGPYVIEHFPDDTTNNLLLAVCAIGGSGCCDEYLFPSPDCDGSETCHVFDLVADAMDCTSDSTLQVLLTFQVNALPEDSVIVTANGVFVGQYAYDPAGITITDFPALPASYTEVHVCAAGAPECCDVFEFLTPDCGQGLPCHIYDLTAHEEGCTSDSTYNLFVGYQANQLPGDSILITVNGEFLGHFANQPGGFILEHVPAATSENSVIVVCAVGAPDCCDVYEYETPDCGQGLPCYLFDLVAEAGDCTSDSTYNLHFQYFTEHFPGDSIQVTVNGESLGHFLHQSGPIMIPDVPAALTVNSVVTVCAVNAPDCCDSFEYATPDCGQGLPCNIYDLVAEAGDCTSDSTYNLHLQYQANFFPGDSILVTINGTSLGHFAHQSGPWMISDVPAATTINSVITVCAVEAPDCCDIFEYETPDCGQGLPCYMESLFAEVGECTSDSTFVLDLVIQGDNFPVDSIIVYANGNYVGQYAVSPTFNRIELFPLLPGAHTVVTVCAAGAPDCCASYEIENPSCGGNACEIFINGVDVFDCTSDSTFGAVVTFEWINVDAGGFDLYAGDEFLGFFNFEQLPAEIPNFPANASGVYTVTVCESDNTECCSTYTFEGPTCGEEPCAIFDLTWFMTECDGEGQFFFVLDFQHANVGNQGFTILGNGNNYGNFVYEELPVELGPFEANGTAYEFVVRDNEFPDCQGVVEPGVVECTTGTDEPATSEIFDVFNNGTTPWIVARQDISLSLFRADGQTLVRQADIGAKGQFTIDGYPDGLYIALVRYHEFLWPVRLVRISH